MTTSLSIAEILLFIKKDGQNMLSPTLPTHWMFRFLCLTLVLSGD